MFQGYLKSLGCTRTAQVKCQARMGEAEAKRDSGIRVMTASCTDIPAPSLRQSIFGYSSFSCFLYCSQSDECIYRTCLYHPLAPGEHIRS